jgi:hypothetical protein
MAGCIALIAKNKLIFGLIVAGVVGSVALVGLGVGLTTHFVLQSKMSTSSSNSKTDNSITTTPSTTTSTTTTTTTTVTIYQNTCNLIIFYLNVFINLKFNTVN